MQNEDANEGEHDDYFNEDDYVKSRTRVKKEAEALQKLGEALIPLSSEQLDTFPLSETLRKAIDDAKRITSNSATKRQKQYIGKLMRSADGEAIDERMEEIVAERHRSAQQHHIVERWRDELIEDPTKMQQFVEENPACDRQQLGQLIRNAKKEAKARAGGAQNPPVNTRKLFKFIREALS